jgi:hypothetical protein
MGKWNPDNYSIKNAIEDMFRKGREVSFDANGVIQKIDVNDDGAATVSWYAPNDSKKQHWHFVFKLDSNGKVVPGSGAMK